MPHGIAQAWGIEDGVVAVGGANLGLEARNVFQHERVGRKLKPLCVHFLSDAVSFLVPADQRDGGGQKEVRHVEIAVDFMDSRGPVGAVFRADFGGIEFGLDVLLMLECVDEVVLRLHEELIVVAGVEEPEDAREGEEGQDGCQEDGHQGGV